MNFSVSISPELLASIKNGAALEDKKLSPYVTDWLQWISENNLDFETFTAAVKKAGLLD